MREDLSYIDGASAVLSRGQGSAFSVRSITLSKLSVKTPLSKMSDNASRFSSHSRLSTISKNNGQLPALNIDPVWNRYKKRASVHHKSMNNIGVMHKSTISISGQKCLAPMPVINDKLGTSQLLDGTATQNNYYT